MCHIIQNCGIQNKPSMKLNINTYQIKNIHDFVAAYAHFSKNQQHKHQFLNVLQYCKSYIDQGIEKSDK